jgi:hypothetical protein
MHLAHVVEFPQKPESGVAVTQRAPLVELVEYGMVTL